jgi:hypothetical protein
MKCRHTYVLRNRTKKLVADVFKKNTQGIAFRIQIIILTYIQAETKNNCYRHTVMRIVLA